MKGIKQIGIHIQCQKNKVMDFWQKEGVSRDGRTEYAFGSEEACGYFQVEKVPGGNLGRLGLELKNRPLEENCNLAMEKPVTLRLYVEERPEKITAMYLFNDWWTRPAFANDFSQIPGRTQVAFLQYADRYACLVPAVGENFKTSLCPGGEDWISLEMTACMGGISRLEEPVFLMAEDETVYGAIEKAFRQLAKEKGIRTRQERRFPEMLRYLGWCSWDAFYTDITEEKVREKARELYGKKVPVRWMLMDDGWLSVEDERLYDFLPEKKKFPDGFAGMIEDIKREGNISWFGVWHALGGYWRGILTGSKLEQKEKEHLYYAANGRIAPSPRKEQGFGFFGDWYEYLKGEGIDFVKVDGQSAVKHYFENSLPLCQAARGIHKALEGGASHMDGQIINCMGMAMENMLARPSSAIARNSDDFVPARENGFGEHLLQNAYNALYQGQLYHCDWDMFWTSHEDGVKHGLLRAVSGGPVYFSDKIGETNPQALEALAYLDGEILMMDRPALPAEDCVFADPMKEGVIKLTNVAAYGSRKAGGVAVYNLTDGAQGYSFSPKDVPELPGDGEYLVYDYFRRTSRICSGGDSIAARLEKGGFAWYQILPFEGDGAFLGLTEKYVGFAAMESVYATKQGMGGVVKEQGAVGFASVRRPGRIFCNGFDVTDLLAREGNGSPLGVYTIALKRKSGKAVLEIQWE